MKKLVFLFLLTSCSNSPKVTTLGNEKTDTVIDTNTTFLNKVNKSTDSNLNHALLTPTIITHLFLSPASIDNVAPDSIKHLPADIGKLTNLKELQICCLENLEDLPVEIGNLKFLEKLIIDQGNGCLMNISIPSSIGNLTNLKELNLDGALDYKTYRQLIHIDSTSPQFKIKELPQTIVNLQNLEILDLGRNGLKEIPPQVFSLYKLRVLKLDYNDISVIPSTISELTHLEELSIISGTSVKLPESMKAFRGLKVNLAYKTLDEPSKKELADQKKLQEEFPNIVFSYDYLD
jgi:Leucine-rich repeat (LRR) protein